jgi:hypothetical protein
MSDGGRRRRSITRFDAPVWCPGGRWGRRRTRTDECYAIFKAEDLYTEILRRDDTLARPGSQGTGNDTIEGRDYPVRWEIRANAVWRRGRVFYVCAR